MTFMTIYLSTSVWQSNAWTPRVLVSTGCAIWHCKVGFKFGFNSTTVISLKAQIDVLIDT